MQRHRRSPSLGGPDPSSSRAGRPYLSGARARQGDLGRVWETEADTLWGWVITLSNTPPSAPIHNGSVYALSALPGRATLPLRLSQQSLRGEIYDKFVALLLSHLSVYVSSLFTYYQRHIYPTNTVQQPTSHFIFFSKKKKRNQERQYSSLFHKSNIS